MLFCYENETLCELSAQVKILSGKVRIIGVGFLCVSLEESWGKTFPSLEERILGRGNLY